MYLVRQVMGVVALVMAHPGCLETESGSPARPPRLEAHPRARTTSAPYAALFAEDQLPSFYLTLDRDGCQGIHARPRQYQSGTLRYRSEDGSQDIRLAKVGIRLKGSFTFMGLHQKPAFKIKMSELVPGQRLLGLRRLTLNNMAQDPSTLRERLAYTVYRAAGVPAPLCNHARVYLNGEYYGLYANVESLDGSFLERHEAAPRGSLYDTRGSPKRPYVDIVPENLRLFQLETNTAGADKRDLKRLMRAFSASDDAFFTAVSREMDVDEFLRVGAVQAVIADWDGYFGSSNNYKLYRAGNPGRFWLLPWGADQSFNIWGFHHNKLDYPIDASTLRRPHGIFFRRCLSHRACRAEYLQKVGEVADLFESMDLHALVDAFLAQSWEAIVEDERAQKLPHHTLEELESSVEAIRCFIDHRADVVFEQLSSGQSSPSPRKDNHN